MYRDYGYLTDYLGLFLILLLLIVGISLLFYFAQYNLLNAIDPQNRLLIPSYVFLQFIPIFGTYYSFIVVAKIAGSIRLEAESRQTIGKVDLIGKPPFELDSARPTYNIGISWCILSVCFGYGIPFFQSFSSVAGIANFICWLIYWSKMTTYKNLIMAE